MYIISPTPEAQEDIENHTFYLDHQSETASFRFRQAIYETFALLAHYPYFGVVFPHKNDKIPDIRRVRLKNSQSYIIYYTVRQKTIIILKILHHSQDNDKQLQKI